MPFLFTTCTGYMDVHTIKKIKLGRYYMINAQIKCMLNKRHSQITGCQSKRIKKIMDMNPAREQRLHGASIFDVGVLHVVLYGIAPPPSLLLPVGGLHTGLHQLV
jgi:hypothetical protein